MSNVGFCCCSFVEPRHLQESEAPPWSRTPQEAVSVFAAMRALEPTHAATATRALAQMVVHIATAKTGAENATALGAQCSASSHLPIRTMFAAQRTNQPLQERGTTAQSRSSIAVAAGDLGAVSVEVRCQACCCRLKRRRPRQAWSSSPAWMLATAAIQAPVQTNAAPATRVPVPNMEAIAHKRTLAVVATGHGAPCSACSPQQMPTMCAGLPTDQPSPQQITIVQGRRKDVQGAAARGVAWVL